MVAIPHGPAQQLSRAKSKHSVKIKIRLKGKMKHLIIGCIPCHGIFYIEETTDMESFHVSRLHTLIISLLLAFGITLVSPFVSLLSLDLTGFSALPCEIESFYQVTLTSS